MAELVDAADSKSVFERSGSSSLPRGTKIQIPSTGDCSKKTDLESVFLCLGFGRSLRRRHGQCGSKACLRKADAANWATPCDGLPAAFIWFFPESRASTPAPDCPTPYFTLTSLRRQPATRTWRSVQNAQYPKSSPGRLTPASDADLWRVVQGLVRKCRFVLSGPPTLYNPSPKPAWRQAVPV